MPKSSSNDTSSATAKRVIAIAYEWVLPPIDFNDFDIALSVGLFDSLSSKPTATTYHARLPSKKSPGRQSDVSGNLGLVFPVSDDGAGKRAAASERLIADAIVWELAKVTYNDSETAILIQGPMLPKLRGRLLYRGIPKHISVWAITWQPEWFWRMEASEQLLLNISGTDISPMYPPEGVDRASRSWVFKKAEKAVFHFELLTNTWDCISTREWSTKCEQDIRALVRTAESNEESISLPGPIKTAHDVARDRSDLEKHFLWFLPQLRDANYKFDSQTSSDDRVLQTIKCIDPECANNILAECGANSPGLFAGTQLLDWSNETEVYAAFRNQQDQLLKVFRGQ